MKERLQKILSFWGDRKLYDKDTMQQLEAALLSGDPNATLQPPGPRPVSLLSPHPSPTLPAKYTLLCNTCMPFSNKSVQELHD